ncbi:MAG: substrate-binding domain-containing protein [Tepidimonas sp.]
MRRMAWAWLLAIGLLSGGACAQTIVVASTTSTEQSGLFAHLLPRFRQATGIEVKVVALGTGQALDMARRGDADVVFVHDKEAEERLVADGWGVQRHDVMVNDFVLVGPRADPAGAQGHDIVAALRHIARANAPFVSRGDKSGTHAAELRFWALTGQPTPGRGYRSCGCGMGPALNMAAGIGAYVLTDRGTWQSFKNRAQLAVLVEGDARLLNPYGVILVNAARHPHIKAAAGQAFIDWITGPAGQAAIASFTVDGVRPFRPNALR